MALLVTCVVIALLATAASASADYQLYSDTGNSITPGATDIGLHADDDYLAVDLPFPVTFYGTQYSQVIVSSNGNIQFGAIADASDSYDPGSCAPSTDFTLPTLFAFQDDLRTDGSGEGVFTTVDGADGSRRFILEWRARYYGSDTPVNFEVIFYEGSQSIDVVYGSNGGATDGTDTDENDQNILLGTQASATGPVTQYSCGNDDYPEDGLRVIYDPTAPAATAAVADCSRSGDVGVTVTDDFGGSGSALVHYRIDGGAEQSSNTSGQPGTATINVPEGRHKLEYRGRDGAGNEPTDYKSQDVVVDRTNPTVSITSDQNKQVYSVGEAGSATVAASDENSGLAQDPSGRVTLDTSSPGDRTVSQTATDRCGNQATASFTYRVVAPARVAAPRIAIAGVRASGCRSTSFTARISVRSSAVTKTRVLLDGRRTLITTARKAIRVRIPARGLSSGRHRITVVTTDEAGNRTVSRASFVRCARVVRVPKKIQFTG